MKMTLSDKLNELTNHRSDLERLQMHQVLYVELQGMVAQKLDGQLCGPIETEEAIEATMIRIFLGYGVVEPASFYMSFEKECIHEMHDIYLDQIRGQIDNPKLSDFIGDRT